MKIHIPVVVAAAAAAVVTTAAALRTWEGNGRSMRGVGKRHRVGWGASYPHVTRVQSAGRAVSEWYRPSPGGPAGSPSPLQAGPLLLTCTCLSSRHSVGQIERVFVAAGHQKVWDHFTKAQRRNIEMWKKQAEVRLPPGTARPQDATPPALFTPT